MKIYDIHITIHEIDFRPYMIRSPWQFHDIKNVQGMSHFLISLKYEGDNPYEEMDKMVEYLKNQGIWIFRRKIELHFDNLDELKDLDGIIEVHYKLNARGLFSVTQEQIAELDKVGVAFSFNVVPQKRIISARFDNKLTYLDGEIIPEKSFYIEEVEKELVIYDSNPDMDSFWPLRTKEFPMLHFRNLPEWTMQSTNRRVTL